MLAEKIKALPQIEASTPIRLGSAEISGSNTFLAAADPTPVAQLYDFGVQSGAVADLVAPNTIAVSTRKADSKHLKVGSVLPARFVQTGNVPLKVAFIYKNNTLAGDYIISLATFEKNFPPQFQLDAQIFAKLKPGVSAAGSRRDRAARQAVPERRAEGQRAVQGRPEEAGQPGPRAGLRACCSSP